jgi:hypothetical protein
LRGGSEGQPASLELVSLADSKLADPPADLDALLEKPGAQNFGETGVRLVASWGKTSGGGYLDLIALTPASRAVEGTTVPVLVLTDRGVYIELVGRTGFGKLATPSDIERMQAEIVPKAAAWIVTAEAGVPVLRIREALGWIAKSHGTVVLATPMPVAGPASQRRPSRYDHAVKKGEPHACSDKLKGGATGAESSEWSMTQMSTAADAFDAAVKPCGASLPVGAGGAIHVMTRIKPDGTVEDACADTDDIGDPTVRACVVEAIKKVSFPKPSKPGIIPFGSAAVFTGKPVIGLCDP